MEQRADAGREVSARTETAFLLTMAASGTEKPGTGRQADIKIQDDYN